jgi:hypothetical protein
VTTDFAGRAPHEPVARKHVTTDFAEPERPFGPHVILESVRTMYVRIFVRHDEPVARRRRPVRKFVIKPWP